MKTTVKFRDFILVVLIIMIPVDLFIDLAQNKQIDDVQSITENIIDVPFNNIDDIRSLSEYVMKLNEAFTNLTHNMDVLQMAFDNQNEYWMREIEDIYIHLIEISDHLQELLVLVNMVQTLLSAEDFQ